VTTIDGRTIGSGEVGPLTSRIAKIYQEHAAANGIRLLEP
jgi:branched-chain amino acid aminotransferase